MPDHISYPGEELVLFQNALHWKRYFSSFIKPYIKKRVLEVGAGLGANTLLLNSGLEKQWVLLEPDKSMAATLQRKIEDHLLPSNCIIINGTIYGLKQDEKFDTIIYIDVLEHIQDDKKEIQKAMDLLAPGGHLIILSPAFNLLYSPFDKAIGHYRRYQKKNLKLLLPEYILPVRLRYLDSLGFLMSLSNRFMLHQRYPSVKQVNFWDRYIIFLSRITDKILVYSFGKTILGIWQKPATKSQAIG